MDVLVKRLFKLGLKPEEIAYRLGVSVSTVFKWKSEETEPSRMAKEKIQKLLGAKKY